jgi:hypothetical protein
MALLAAVAAVEKCIIFRAASLAPRARVCPYFAEFISFVCVMLSLGLFLSFSRAQTNKRRERNEEHKFAQLADCS